MASLMEFFPALIDFPVILSILCICFYTLVFFTKLLLMFFLGFAGAFIRSILIMSRFSQNSFVGFEILDMLFSLLYLFFFSPSGLGNEDSTRSFLFIEFLAAVLNCVCAS